MTQSRQTSVPPPTSTVPSRSFAQLPSSTSTSRNIFTLAGAAHSYHRGPMQPHPTASRALEGRSGTVYKLKPIGPRPPSLSARSLSDFLLPTLSAPLPRAGTVAVLSESGAPQRASQPANSPGSHPLALAAHLLPGQLPSSTLTRGLFDPASSRLRNLMTAQPFPTVCRAPGRPSEIVSTPRAKGAQPRPLSLPLSGAGTVAAPSMSTTTPQSASQPAGSPGPQPLALVSRLPPGSAMHEVWSQVCHRLGIETQSVHSLAGSPSKAGVSGGPHDDELPQAQRRVTPRRPPLPAGVRFRDSWAIQLPPLNIQRPEARPPVDSSKEPEEPRSVAEGPAATSALSPAKRKHEPDTDGDRLDQL